jgi:hypothetical protein
VSFGFLTTCIGCGCTDESACVSIDDVPCFWIRKDIDAGVGVCSHCPEDAARFDQGDRRLHDEVAENDGHGHFDDDSRLVLPGDDDFDETLELL